MASNWSSSGAWGADWGDEEEEDDFQTGSVSFYWDGL